MEIPRLEDVLERFKGQDFMVTVELKSDNTEKVRRWEVNGIATERSGRD